LLVICIVALAAVLRFIFISANEAHFDEIWYLEISTGRGEAHSQLPINQLVPSVPDFTSLTGAPPWHAIYTHMSGQPHPPLHPLLLRGWRELFGESLPAGRMLSAVLSALCVLVMFDAVRQISRPSVALWAALLLALSSAQVQQAQEIRQYTLLTLMALCAADALLRIERSGPSFGRAIALLASLLGMLFTHYFALPAIVAMGVYAVVRLRGRSRGVALLTVAVAAAVFTAAWGPMIPRQAAAFAANSAPGVYGDSSAVADHFRLTLHDLATAPLRLLFDPRPDNALVAVLSGSVLALPWLVLRRSPQLLLWAIWLTAVIGFALVLDLTRSTRHLSMVRHFILAGPALCAILPQLVGDTRRPLLANGFPALLSLCCAAALGLTYTRPAVRLSGIAELLADAHGTNEPIVFYTDPPMTWWGQWLCLSSMHYAHDAFPRPVAILDRPADSQLVASLRRFGGAWIVSAGTPLHPTQMLPGCKVISTHEEPFVASVTHVQWVDPP
jgi:uncharacterized membrane protein